MISNEPLSAEWYLVEAECSLLQQSRADPERLQGDGWGIGYYVDGASCAVRSEKPIYVEVDRYKSVALNTRSKIILAHIRKASNPRGLPSEKLLSIENSQPFFFRNILFVHNGTINIPDEASELLGNYKGMIKGVNDSEIYFWFLVKSIDDGESVEAALIGFEDALQKLWRDCFQSHPKKRRPYVGLNAIFSDGEKLYAYCRYSEEDSDSPSICLRDQPVFQMCFLPGNPLVVASEKMTKSDEWIPLKSGQLLTSWAKGTKVEHRVEMISRV
jgi:glutamine amidotransferase